MHAFRVEPPPAQIDFTTQHLEGEPRDLIEGCLHMDPEEGYSEARQLLQKEYGDPYKISTVYINKILRWAPIKLEDNQGLKRLSIFLTKCKIAMKNISCMCVLNHAPNMQAVVSKLPPNVQNKWRDQAVKRKKTNSSNLHRPRRVCGISFGICKCSYV